MGILTPPLTPVASLAYALDHVGITAHDIEHVATPASSREYFDAVVMGFYLPLVERYPTGIGALRIALDTFKGLHRLEGFLRSEFPSASVHMLDHHLCHVTSAHFCSPFDESASMTVDGRGEWATTTFSHVKGSSVRTLKRVGFPASLGLLYTNTSRLLGFGGPNPEGKVMGLASYGEPRFIDVFRDALVVTGKMEFAWSLSITS